MWFPGYVLLLDSQVSLKEVVDIRVFWIFWVLPLIIVHSLYGNENIAAQLVGTEVYPVHTYPEVKTVVVKTGSLA
jgi:hypothetical protein